jgi:hypothetical protein
VLVLVLVLVLMLAMLMLMLALAVLLAVLPMLRSSSWSAVAAASLAFTALIADFVVEVVFASVAELVALLGGRIRTAPLLLRVGMLVSVLCIRIVRIERLAAAAPPPAPPSAPPPATAALAALAADFTVALLGALLETLLILLALLLLIAVRLLARCGLLGLPRTRSVAGLEVLALGALASRILATLRRTLDERRARHGRGRRR